MKLKFHWIGLALLAGCQTAPSTENTQPETPLSGKTPTVITPSKTDTTPTEVTPIEPAPTPQEQEDVWQRIAMQLDMPIPDHESVDYYRNWYIKHPSHLRTVAKRAQPFLYMITVEIEKRGLPMELVLLPVVESAFDPFAYSHGSAAGLWQFVPGTADRFKLERNWWYDGRRDVPAATTAALDYMEYFDRRFDGNWQQS